MRCFWIDLELWKRCEIKTERRYNLRPLEKSLKKSEINENYKNCKSLKFEMFSM